MGDLFEKDEHYMQGGHTGLGVGYSTQDVESLLKIARTVHSCMSEIALFGDTNPFPDVEWRGYERLLENALQSFESK